MVQVWWLCWWDRWEWTGGVLVSIRAELDKEKMGEDLVIVLKQLCVCVCVCVRACVHGCGHVRMCVCTCSCGCRWVCEILYFTQTQSGVPSSLFFSHRYHCLCGDSPVGVMASRKSPSVMSAVRCLCVDSGLVHLLLHKHLSRCVSLRTEWCPFSVPDNLVVYVSSADSLK